MMKKLPKIKISIPFFLLLATMYVLDFCAVFYYTFIAVIIHESAHISATRLCGGTIDAVDVRAFGIRVNVPELEYMSYRKEIIIAAAGPIAGLITALIATAAAEIFDMTDLTYFIGVNIVITAINLIPVYPLDGGRIVLSLLLMCIPVRCAYAISYTLTILSIIALMVFCIILASMNSLNPSLVIFSVYIAVCGVKFRPIL